MCSNNIGITILPPGSAKCAPYTTPASYINHGFLKLSDVIQTIHLSLFKRLLCISLSTAVPLYISGEKNTSILFPNVFKMSFLVSNANNLLLSFDQLINISTLLLQ